jgi:hypothetical protein
VYAIDRIAGEVPKAFLADYLAVLPAEQRADGVIRAPVLLNAAQVPDLLGMLATAAQIG